MSTLTREGGNFNFETLITKSSEVTNGMSVWRGGEEKEGGGNFPNERTGAAKKKWEHL